MRLCLYITYFISQLHFCKKTVILYKKSLCLTFVDVSILTIVQIFTNFRTLSKIEGFERIGSFENSSLPNWYIDGKEPVAQAGTQQGLTIILDAHSNILSRFSVVDDFEGFEGIVTPQGYHIFLCFVVSLSYTFSFNVIFVKNQGYFLNKVCIYIV